MRKRKQYTEEQLQRFLMNPYTFNATPYRITFTLAFKEFFMSQIDVQGMTTRKIMQAAGYLPEDFSRGALDQLRVHIKAQAASPEGLQPPKGQSIEEKNKAFAEKKLAEQKTEQSIVELQKHVAHLEAQVEFLKKISFLSDQQSN
ncbi:MAG: hypothetical protein HUJ83_11100 [Veillonella sp.]|nr:hypothetical protein [Veillonella sp.]